jgi:hypothetical protein
VQANEKYSNLNHKVICAYGFSGLTAVVVGLIFVREKVN